jgi:heme/copper-type cytochrome/quinol oxidase subunit 2
VARPLTRRRIATLIAIRAFAIALLTAAFVGLLIAAISAGSQSAWTLFGVFGLFWVFVVATYTWVAVLIIRARRLRRQEAFDQKSAEPRNRTQ